MSETFGEAKASWRRLRSNLQNADEDTRYKFAYWVIGRALMATAIMAQFGWNGAIFCVGVMFWAIAG